MRTIRFTAVLLTLMPVMACGYGSNYNGGNPMPGVAPHITDLAPNSANAGDAGFTLTVNGSGFATGAVVYWNGAARTTSYVTTSQVTAAISASDIANAGMMPVYVLSGGQNSNSVNFTVN